MPEPNTVANPASTQDAPASTTAPNQEAPSQEFTADQYRALQTELSETKRTLQNTEVFFNSDPDVRERVQWFTDSYKNGKRYEDVLRENLSKKTTTETTPKKTDSPAGPSEDQIRQIVERQIQDRLGSTLAPVNDQLAAIQGEREANNILKANTWATQKDVSEFEERLMKAATERAQQDVQANYPRLSQKDAMARSWDYYGRFETNDLFNKFMQDKRDAWVVSGRRPTPTLPTGAKDDITEGVDPGLDTKFQAALKGAEGDGNKIAELVREYAPQYGIDSEDPKAVMSFYKKMVR